MRRNGLGISFIILGIVCLGIALGVYVKNLAEQKNAQKASEQAIHELLELIPENEDKAETEPAEQTDVIDSLGTAEDANKEIPDYQLNPQMDMPKAKVQEISYIGYIRIPALNLQLPLIHQTTKAYLKKAPCRLYGSAYLDNLVIGAHNYVRHFRNIGKLSYGDRITVTDLDGNTFLYEVATVEILKPNQGIALCSGEWPLTLYTCTLGGRTRIVVRCERIEE